MSSGAVTRFTAQSSAVRIPAPSRGFVPRPRLLQSLDDALHRARIVEVVAPLGFGKTQMLAHWARETERSFCWLSIDDSLRSSRRSRDVASAALQVAARRDPRLVKVSDAIQAQGLSRDSDDVLRALAELSEGLVVILDSLHLLPEVIAHGLLADLVLHGPPSVSFVVASRSRLVSISRLRLDGEVTTIADDELAFTEQEIAAQAKILARSPGPDDLAGIRSLTGGWPAGVRLVCSASAAESARELLQEYVAEHSLSLLTPDLRSFVLR